MPTLLLADADVAVQRMIAASFATEDIAVTLVNNGDEAIVRIAQDRPDVVILSVATPKRSGYDVAAFVRSKPELAATPVLLLAGASEVVDDVRAGQVRCDGVLVKPLEPQKVVARVRELLRRSGATAQAAATLEPARTPPARSTDEFFERLDAAFAQRVAGTRGTVDDAGVVPTLDAVLNAPAKTPAEIAVPTAAAPPVITDAQVDEVTRRVVERLGTRALRDVVADVVADVAERLVREEIARIRNPR